MARIAEEAIERVKERTDLAALVRSRGIELKAHGNGHFAGSCPFHEDAEPSLIITPEKGLFHCMGCGKAGNAIQFVQAFDGISFANRTLDLRLPAKNRKAGAAQREQLQRLGILIYSLQKRLVYGERISQNRASCQSSALITSVAYCCL